MLHDTLSNGVPRQPLCSQTEFIRVRVRAWAINFFFDSSTANIGNSGRLGNFGHVSESMFRGHTFLESMFHGHKFFE